LGLPSAFLGVSADLNGAHCARSDGEKAVAITIDAATV